MASDILERLRHCSENCGDEYLHELAGRAAAEIERLRAALEPFGKAWEVATHTDAVRFLTLGQLGALAVYEVSGTHFQRAAAALPQEKPND